MIWWIVLIVLLYDLGAYFLGVPAAIGINEDYKFTPPISLLTSILIVVLWPLVWVIALGVVVGLKFSELLDRWGIL